MRFTAMGKWSVLGRGDPPGKVFLDIYCLGFSDNLGFHRNPRKHVIKM